jgi:hypothetical protein
LSLPPRLPETTAGEVTNRLNTLCCNRQKSNRLERNMTPEEMRTKAMELFKKRFH